MSSYISNLLTQTTSRYNSLRRTLLASEDDGDTEDDTHVCRVLRAYYTEKGRAYPQWLPPDPNDRKAVTPQPYAQQASSYFAAKNPYGAVQQAQPNPRASLSDLWDPPTAAQPSTSVPTSLRNARRPANPSQPPSSASLAPPQARPLPSQRAGSYQTVASQRSAAESSPSSSTSSVAGGTAQDRLKARLWGGRSSTPSSVGAPSPALSQVGAPDSYDQPSMGGNAARNNANPYDRGSGNRYGR